MTRSERVHAIRETSERLQKYEWPLINMTLRQFGLPTSDNWHGGKSSYCIQMIETSTDEILSELHHHLSGGTKIETSIETPDFWQPGTYKIFLSHRTTHKEEAGNLKDEFNNFHITTFVAHADIQPTKSWQEEIELALATCDCVVALVTDDFHESEWTDQELGIAMGKNKLIIPVNCGGNPYGFLSKYQWLKADVNDPSVMSRKVFQILSKHPLSKKEFSSALVNKFESSYTFESAMKNMTLLENVEYLNKDMIKRVKKAVVENRQISGAYGVAYRAKRLIEKYEK